MHPVFDTVAACCALAIGSLILIAPPFVSQQGSKIEISIETLLSKQRIYV